MSGRSPISWNLDQLRKSIESEHGRISLLLLTAADAIDERDRRICDLERQVSDLKLALEKKASPQGVNLEGELIRG